MREPDGSVRKRILPLTPFYARSIYPLIYLIIGLACIAIGLVAFILRPDDRKARIYYWLNLAFGLAIIISGEFYCVGRAWTTYAPSLLFIVGYAAAPPLLLLFSLTFASGDKNDKKKNGRNALILVPAALVAAAQTAAFLIAFLKPSIEVFRAYNAYYFLFRIYIILYVVLAVYILLRSFRRSRDDEERAQIQWIFFGLVAGMVPFVFLYQVPVALGAKPLISEEFASIFFIGIPVAFFIAIVRYRLMHIHLVIKRSLVYSALTVFTVGVYFLFLEVARDLFAGLVSGHEMIVSAAGVILAAFAFQPAQRWIQTAVDKAFFRQRYDYGQTISSFIEEARKYVSRIDLFEFFRREIMSVLPMVSLAVSSSEGRSAKKSGGPESAEPGMEWSLPLSLDPGEPPSSLIFGRKKSGSRYSLEDKELLRTMSGELQVNLDRIRLQEEVIYERASREKMEELDKLKTEFISTVSHELRTPLSSIQSMAELLESGRIRDRDKADKFLAVMAAESARLSRFLHNILDYGKIEQGAAVYHLQPAILQDVVKETVELFRPVAEERGFDFALSLPDEPVRLHVDADAVKQALSNLIDNAIKYSREKKRIHVELVEGERTWDIRVKDDGIGIAAGDIDKIFRKFYRASGAGAMCPEGAGLGLKIIRHIMDAHAGDVRVESQEGEGSLFTLAFPKARET